jgi:hypothetical protein
MTAAILVVSLHSCYYDNVEELYPSSSNCDTTNVNYTNDVWPVINAQRRIPLGKCILVKL